MAVSHDVLIRFVYGELPPDEARSVALAMESDPDLRALVDQQRKLRARLERAHTAEPGNVPPDHTAIAAMRGEVAQDGTTARAGLARNLIAGGAAAMGLLLGILVAGSLGLGADIRNERGALVAGGALARALSRQLSGDQGQIVIVTSFWSNRESFCRSFLLRGGSPNAIAGIGCREGGVWRLTALGDAKRGTGANDENVLPPLIRNGAAAMIAGETLDEPAERALRAQNWRPR